MQQPTIIAPGCYAATSETHGTRYFPSMTLACLWLIDPENPLFGPYLQATDEDRNRSSVYFDSPGGDGQSATKKR